MGQGPGMAGVVGPLQHQLQIAEQALGRKPDPLGLRLRQQMNAGKRGAGGGSPEPAAQARGGVMEEGFEGGIGAEGIPEGIGEGAEGATLRWSRLARWGGGPRWRRSGPPRGNKAGQQRFRDGGILPAGRGALVCGALLPLKEGFWIPHALHPPTPWRSWRAVDGSAAPLRGEGGGAGRGARGGRGARWPRPGVGVGQQPAPSPRGSPRSRRARGPASGGLEPRRLALQRLHSVGHPRTLSHVRRCFGAGSDGNGGVRRPRPEAGGAGRLPRSLA